MIEIEPPIDQWPVLVDRRPNGDLGAQSLEQWRGLTRRELGLALDRPILATGHQSTLWHPGILAKYLVADAVAESLGIATANLVVDQHVGEFGEIDVPVRDAGGRLAERTYQMTDARPEVPMGLHPAFAPRAVPPDLSPALESVKHGLQAIRDAIARHQRSRNAACQMSQALADLMREWVRPMVDVTATQLIATSLGRALLARMIDDPRAASESYNGAVAAVPEGGIGPLDVRDDSIELPVWKIDASGRRVRGFDHDVRRWLDDPGKSPTILPRALFMTALVRLGMCDLFVHGKGGATYDRAMEFWVKSWLGVEPSPIAMATATLHLPLGQPITDQQAAEAIALSRRTWHDPESLVDHQLPSAAKRELVQAIAAMPRGSRVRRAAYARLHRQLASWRQAQADTVQSQRDEAEIARRRIHERPVVTRRTWAFPLYPRDMLEQLALEARIATQSLKPMTHGQASR
jgi:hypothetical protein